MKGENGDSDHCNSRLDKEIRMAVHGICHECYGIEKAEPK